MIKKSVFGKRALSEIVSTVLIIVLVVGAIAIVWAAVVPMIRNNLGTDSCKSVDVSIGTSGYTCYIPNNLTLVQIKKGPQNINVTGLKIYLVSQGNSRDYQIINTLSPSQEKTFYLNSSNLATIEKIEVVPIVKENSATKDCAKTFIESIPVCGTTAIFPENLVQENQTSNQQPQPPADPLANIPLTGLVSYYKLDETSGAVIDAKGTNNGTNNGATTNQQGIINKSYSFNGVANYIDLGNANYNFGNTFSLSFWIYSSNFLQNGGLIGKWTTGAGTNNSYAVTIGQDRGSNQLGFYLQQSNNTIKSLLPPNTLSNSSWYHVVAVADGNYMHLYLNGNEIGAPVSYDGTIKSTTTKLLIGRVNEGGTYPLNGNIDEVGIWNSALTAIEIKQLYENSGRTFTAQFNPLLMTGLVSYYPFDSNVNDIFGLHNGALLNPFTATYVQGKLANGISLSGTTNSGINITNPIQLSNYSVSFWMKAGRNQSQEGFGALFGAGNDLAAYLYDGDRPIEQLQFFNSSGQMFINQVGQYIDTWNQITFVATPTNQSLYLNGVYASSSSDFIMPTLKNIGMDEYPGNTAYNFNGTLDEFYVFNRTLSQSEITQLYNYYS